MNVPQSQQQQQQRTVGISPTSTYNSNTNSKPSIAPTTSQRPHIASTSANTIDLTDEDDPRRGAIIQNGTNPPALVAIPPQSKPGQKVTYVMQPRPGQQNNPQRIALQKVGNQYSKYCAHSMLLVIVSLL